MRDTVFLISAIFFLIIVNFFTLKINFLVTLIFLFIFQLKKIPLIMFLGKIKFFLVTLFLIYALATPGKVLYFYYFVSITQEGILLGSNNLFRLLNTFMTIFLLMKIVSKNSLIGFIVKLVYPFKYLNLDIDRVTARLYLTLTYLDYYKNYPFKFSNLLDVINQNIKYQGFKRVHSIQKIHPTYEDIFLVFIGISIFFLIKYFKFI
mgnify:CR=1 FL=1